MRSFAFIRWFFIFSLICGLTDAQVTLPRIFSNHMVLQQEIPVPLWGWATKGEKIQVSFNGQTLSARADNNGRWKVTLAPMKAGGPFEMTIRGKNTLTLHDILIGEVWICSGQSNMEFPLSQVKDGANEVASANYPRIRLFTVPKKMSTLPLNDLDDGKWDLCTPETAAGFSAAGYFFGRHLHHELNVPVGLINSSWGGTIVETWMSREAAMADPDLSEWLASVGTLDLEKAQAESVRKIAEWYQNLDKNDKGLNERWFAAEYDDASWKEMNLPCLWETDYLPDYDGVVWFRKEFILSEEDALGESTLELGPIDDSDFSFINGISVGSTINKYNVPRIYKVSAGVLRKGKNVISIRVIDTGGGGGMWGEKNQMFLQLASGKKIDLSGIWKFAPSFEGRPPQQTFSGPNSYPTLLYNAMIHPIIPYAIKGAIWYQGESNAGRAEQYRRLFPALIADWRNKWNEGNFPFLYVQLANFMAPDKEPAESAWAELREAQTMTLSVPNTGMACIIDIGEANDIHPKNKQDVGKRLALAGLKVAYNRDIVYSGPLYQSYQTEGNKIRISFSNIGSGLMAKDKYGYVKGFAIAGEDKKFVWAQAFIDGNTVVVYSPSVQKPVAVRYAWGNNPDDANLYNKEGLPAVPFRTDNWKMITAGKK